MLHTKSLGHLSFSLEDEFYGSFIYNGMAPSLGM